MGGSAGRCLGFCAMAVASGGVLYVADGENNTSRKGMPAGSVPALVPQQPVPRVAPVAFRHCQPSWFDGRPKSSEAGLSPGLAAMRTFSNFQLFRTGQSDAVPQTNTITHTRKQLHFCIAIDVITLPPNRNPASHQYW